MNHSDYRSLLTEADDLDKPVAPADEIATYRAAIRTSVVNNPQQGWIAFVIYGIVLNVICVMATTWWLRRRGWR